MSTEAAQNNGLVSLVYISSSIRLLDRQEIFEILRKSRANNGRLDITGMLLYKDGNFMQALEGPEAKVSDLFSRIERDTRHRGLITLIKKPIQERSFANWSMAYRDLNGLPPDDAEAVSPFLTNSLLDQEFRSKPELSYRLLLHFKQNLR